MGKVNKDGVLRKGSHRDRSESRCRESDVGICHGRRQVVVSARTVNERPLFAQLNLPNGQ